VKAGIRREATRMKGSEVLGNKMSKEISNVVLACDPDES